MKCSVCDGRGFVSMGPNVRGVKACAACGGTGELREDTNSYFEIADMCTDENGNSCPAGMKINIAFKDGADSQSIIKSIAGMLNIDPSRVIVISKEKYEAEYAEEEENYDEDWEED